MKGQAAAIDVIFSTTLLALLVFGLIVFIDVETRNSQAGLMDQTRDRLALAAVAQLVQTAGQPEDWNSSDCTRIGLSCGEGSICTEKISKLSSLYASNYNKTRSLMNLEAYQVAVFICSPSNYTNCDYNITTPARENARLSSSHVSRAEMLSTVEGGKAVSVIVFAWEFSG